eukprot:TRINITY_DN5133_c0_g1_i2.p1 TRINITY_DN5133_c0_g1~~TRINITY_DN5133_c0_g1_i2.p1  ORF type:complete len:1194 (-),score=306.98 TRINITY_DN5133_c0_g1_i2:36-3449(-)
MKDDPRIISYALLLVQQSNDFLVRHFGLHVLEHIIKHKWVSFQAEDKNRFKEFALQLFVSGTADIEHEKLFIKEKVVSILVEIAKYEWPHNWEALNTTVFGAATNNPTHAELTMMVLRSLAESVKVYNDNMSEKRKRDMVNGLNALLPQFFPFTYHLLEQSYGALIQCKGALGRAHLLLCKSILDTLNAYVEWVPINYIFDNNFAMVFCQILGQEDLRMQAAELLLLLANRKGRVPERTQLLFPMTNPYLPVVANSVGPVFNSIPHHNFVCRIAQVLCMVGLNYVDIVSKSDPQQRMIVPAALADFLAVALAFLSHKSHLVSSLILPFWLQLLRCKPITKDPQARALLTPLWEKLLHVSFSKCVRFSGDLDDRPSASTTPPPTLGMISSRGLNASSSIPGAEHEYIKAGFESREEFAAFFSLYRSKFLELYRLGAVFQPVTTLSFTVTKLQEALGATHNVACDVSEDSECWKLLEVSITILQNVVMSPASKQEELMKIDELCGFAIKCLVEYSNKNPLLLHLIMSGFKALTTYLGNHPDVLRVVLEKTLMVAQLVAPPELSSQTAMAISQTRQKAFSVLIRLATCVPNAMKPYSGELLPMLRSLLAAPTTTEGEKILLYEAVTLLSNTTETVEQQAALLDSTLEDVLTQWASAEMSSHLGNVLSCVQYVSSFSSLSGIVPEEEAVIRRKRLYFNMNVLHNVWRRCNVRPVPGDGTVWAVWGQVQRVLPNLALLVRSLHELWNPVLRTAAGPGKPPVIPPEWHVIFNVPDSVLANLIGSHAKKPTTAQEYLQLSLEHLRDFAYNMGGWAATKSGCLFYRAPGFAKFMLESFFSNLNCMDNRHLFKLLRSLVAPIVSQCPVSDLPTVAEPLLPLFLNEVNARLKAGWLAYIARESANCDSASSDSACSAQEEIVADKVLRDLSRDYLDMLGTLVGVYHAERAGERQQQYHYFLHSTVLTPLFVTSAMEALCYPDSPSVQRASSICNKLVTVLSGFPEGPQMECGMLGAIFRSFRLQASELMHGADQMAGLLTTACALVALLGGITTPACLQVLSTLPNVTEKNLQALVTRYNQSEQGRPKALKSFLKSVVGMSPNKRGNILNIPIQVFATQQAQQNADQTSGILDTSGGAGILDTSGGI